MFQWEARPHICQAQNLADNLKRVGCVPPPVLWVESILAGETHDQRGIRADQFFQMARTRRVCAFEVTMMTR